MSRNWRKIRAVAFSKSRTSQLRNQGWTSSQRAKRLPWGSSQFWTKEYMRIAVPRSLHPPSLPSNNRSMTSTSLPLSTWRRLRKAEVMWQRRKAPPPNASSSSLARTSWTYSQLRLSRCRLAAVHSLCLWRTRRSRFLWPPWLWNETRQQLQQNINNRRINWMSLTR